jgi:hypothetical protein
MTKFDRSDGLQGAEFMYVNLQGARFVESDLSGIVMRGVEVKDADIDSPWLFEEGQRFHVNGIDVVPFVEAELDRRFPGRSERRAEDPDGLRAAWAKLERAWEAAVERAGAMPPGTVDVSVDGEWSFAQTLRHLVFATDLWLGQAVLNLERPVHPIGVAHADPGDKPGRWTFVQDAPSYAEVLRVRAERVAMVRDFLAAVTPDELAAPRLNPHNQHPKTTLSCLHTILEEEWEHLRFAVRDLDAIEAGSAGLRDPEA